MILNIKLVFSQSHRLNQLRNGLQFMSTVPKKDPKVKEIKDFILKQNKLNANTSDVKKAVLLYVNERSQFFRQIFVINCLQFVFWAYMANQGVGIITQKWLPNKSTDNKPKSDDSIVTKIKYLWNENKLPMITSFVLLSVGQLSVCLLALYTIRSIRYIHLSPGGQSVRITTFSVTGSPNRYRIHDIPLHKISTPQHRTSAGSYLPIKVKGKSFHFICDTRGLFLKPFLFDQTVGVFRILK